MGFGNKNKQQHVGFVILSKDFRLHQVAKYIKILPKTSNMLETAHIVSLNGQVE